MYTGAKQNPLSTEETTKSLLEKAKELNEAFGVLNFSLKKIENKFLTNQNL